jgi:SAM-dependent methyltransferase
MTAAPLVWHYGLMAERWAEFVTDTPQLAYLQASIARFGQPVLDLACGAGRLLLPLARAGVDIDGCDLSGDMLKHCRRKVESEGLRPQLYEQPMHDFELPRSYRTIYLCDSFGLAGSRENDLATLRCCHRRLQPGGALVLNIQADYTSADAWTLWRPEGRRALPQSWPEAVSRRTASDGSEHAARFRMLDVDPLAQTYTRQVRLEKWVRGERVALEEYSLRGNLYLACEVRLMLQVAGFGDITLHGDYADQPATPDSAELVFTARK